MTLSCMRMERVFFFCFFWVFLVLISITFHFPVLSCLDSIDRETNIYMREGTRQRECFVEGTGMGRGTCRSLWKVLDGLSRDIDHGAENVPRNNYFIRSFIHLFIHSFIHSFMLVEHLGLVQPALLTTTTPRSRCSDLHPACIIQPTPFPAASSPKAAPNLYSQKASLSLPALAP